MAISSANHFRQPLSCPPNPYWKAEEPIHLSFGCDFIKWVAQGFRANCHTGDQSPVNTLDARSTRTSGKQRPTAFNRCFLGCDLFEESGQIKFRVRLILVKDRSTFDLSLTVGWSLSVFHGSELWIKSSNNNKNSH